MARLSNRQRMTAAKLRSPGWADRPPPGSPHHPWGAVHGRARARPSGHARLPHPSRPPGRGRAPPMAPPGSPRPATGPSSTRSPSAWTICGTRTTAATASAARRSRRSTPPSSRSTRWPRCAITAAPPAPTPAGARWPAGCASRRRGASAPTPRGPTRCSTSAAGWPACARPVRGWRSPSTPRSPKGWRARGARATFSASRPARRSAWPRSCSAARTEPSSATPTSASTRSTGTPRSSPTPRR